MLYIQTKHTHFDWLLRSVFTCLPIAIKAGTFCASVNPQRPLLPLASGSLPVLPQADITVPIATACCFALLAFHTSYDSQACRLHCVAWIHPCCCMYQWRAFSMLSSIARLDAQYSDPVTSGRAVGWCPVFGCDEWCFCEHVCTYFLTLFLWVNIRSGIAESYGKCIFRLIRNCQAVFLSACVHLVLVQQCRRAPAALWRCQPARGFLEAGLFQTHLVHVQWQPLWLFLKVLFIMWGIDHIL